MAMTVTAAQGGSTAAGMVLRVYVITGAKTAALQAGGSANAQFTGATAWTQSITTSAGSDVCGAAAAGNNGPGLTGSNASVVDNVPDTANTESYITFKALNVTAGATARGFTSTAAMSGPFAMCEILASGALAEDASAPAAVSTTTLTTVTTASFTPPAGSLLVAVTGTDGGLAVTTMTVSGGGLTWTEKVKNNPSGGDYAGVWIADVPGGAAPQDVLSQAPYAPPPAVRPIPPQVITGPVPQAGMANAGLAAGTAAALNATALVVGSATAGLATGAGTAQGASLAVTANAGLAAGAAAAPQPSVSAIGTTGQPAVQSFTAAFPVPFPVAPQVITGPVPAAPGAGLAAGTASAPGATSAITVNAGLAAGAGAALQPVISTSGSANATAGVASGTAAALQPAAGIAVNAGLATAAATAQAPGQGATAGLATGAGTAQGASLAATALAQAATALAAALAVTVPSGTSIPVGTLTAASAAAGTLTAADQRTGGPGG